jgi:non-heme chloroperoxidase
LELEAAVVRFKVVLHQSNEEVANLPPIPPRTPIGAAMTFGMQKVTNIPVPVLAIYACPHNWDGFPTGDPTRKAALVADDTARCCNAWADAFSRGVPGARVVRIPNADHYVYLSNEREVIAEMNGFLAGLR